jgi:hypothetical protein
MGDDGVVLFTGQSADGWRDRVQAWFDDPKLRRGSSLKFARTMGLVFIRPDPAAVSRQQKDKSGSVASLHYLGTQALTKQGILQGIKQRHVVHPEFAADAIKIVVALNGQETGPTPKFRPFDFHHELVGWRDNARKLYEYLESGTGKLVVTLGCYKNSEEGSTRTSWKITLNQSHGNNTVEMARYKLGFDDENWQMFKSMILGNRDAKAKASTPDTIWDNSFDDLDEWRNGTKSKFRETYDWEENPNGEREYAEAYAAELYLEDQKRKAANAAAKGFVDTTI